MSEAAIPYEKLTVFQAQAARWQMGRQKYGPVFVGDPLIQLYEELLDAMNYCEELTQRGEPIEEIHDVLGTLATQVKWRIRAQRRR